MKYAKLLKIAAIAMVAACGSALAEPVDAEAAKEAVAGWVNLGEALGGEMSSGPESAATYTGTDGKGQFHVVALADGGYVVTSSDDELNPIIAYSRTGTFDPNPANPLFALLSADAAALADSLASTANTASGSGRRMLAASSSSDNASRWRRLRAAAAPSSRPRLRASVSNPPDLRVDSFVQSKWGQTTAKGYKYYNYYTPGTYCGCVATAGAQAMRYFEWPTTAVQAQTFTCAINSVDTDLTMKGGIYDWGHMPFDPKNTTYAETNAISTGKLTYDIGVTVGMNYKSQSSGAFTGDLAVSLKDVFGYSNAIYKYKSTGLDFGLFKTNVLSNLDAKRPVVVGIAEGTDSNAAGHAIVADGYGYSSDNNTLYIHFNMGWEGSNDTWYTPTYFQAGGWTFTTIRCIIFNVFTTETALSSIASGRVLDQDGKPVAGATVTAKYNNSTSATATTDSNGVYALILPPTSPARTYKVSASLTGYTTEECNVKASQTTSDYKNADGTSIITTGTTSNSYDNDMTIIDMDTLTPAATPVINPKSGTMFFSLQQKVVISCETEGAEIHYTTDGSEPTLENGSVYTGPFAISQSCTVKARAYAIGKKPESAVATATYVRSQILGANFVQNQSLAAGGSQTVSLPIVGDYTVSFSYSGSGEIQLIKDGVTNVVATVASSGATNLTWTADAVGEWELRWAGGASVSNLSVSIPATEENVKRYWVYETPYTFGSTGTWTGARDEAKGLLGKDGCNAYASKSSPAGRIVTYTAKVNLDSGEDLLDMSEDTKAAVGLRTVNNVTTFALLTKSEGNNEWVDVQAEGVTAQSNTEYTITFTLDCTNRTYSASVDVNGTATPLALNGTNNFAFAGNATPVSGAVEFMDCNNATMLVGSYDDIAGFVPEDVVKLKGDDIVELTDDQAEWLNAMDNYDVVCAKLKEMTAEKFEEAWLLNLDLTADSPALVSFSIAGIDVTDEYVEVSIALERNGVMEDAKINGVLQLYGGEELGDLTPLTATPVGADDFGSESTAVLRYPRSGPARFFRAVISAP